jgi:hypothetical protein
MKAALAARPKLEIQARLQALGQQAVSLANLTGQSVATLVRSRNSSTVALCSTRERRWSTLCSFASLYTFW